MKAGLYPVLKMDDYSSLPERTFMNRYKKGVKKWNYWYTHAVDHV